MSGIFALAIWTEYLYLTVPRAHTVYRVGLDGSGWERWIVNVRDVHGLTRRQS